MPDYIDENGAFTDDFRTDLPELLGDDYYNDPETKQQPTKELDNVRTIGDMARMVVKGSRKISAHGEELKKATEGMIKIPGEGATEEEISNYRKSIGVPDTPDGYKLKIPEDDKDGYEAIAKEVRAAAHESGIPMSKLSTVWEKVVNQLIIQRQALDKKGMELLAADVKALKDAKKEKYDSFIADTDRVAAHFDIKADAAAGIEENPVGSNFMNLMDTMGIKDTPVVREFLGAIAPLVLEGSTLVGAGKTKFGESAQGPGPGGSSYEYDEHGKPI